MIEELKPCPCCKPEEGEDEEPVLVTVSTDVVDNYYVQCQNNNCQIKTIFFETKEEAIKAWHTRPREDELEKRIAELDEVNIKLASIARDSKAICVMNNKMKIITDRLVEDD